MKMTITKLFLELGSEIMQQIFKFLFQIFFILSLYTDQVIANEASEMKLSNIYKNIRCLVCQGQSIEDSNSDFAVNLRMIIKSNHRIFLLKIYTHPFHPIHLQFYLLLSFVN